jgi:PIN domain nuclease of toxin-antitoxin system
VRGEVVVDTHVLLWWLGAPEALSSAAAEALDQAARVWVPAICAWEIAMLQARGRITLDRPLQDWLQQAFDHPRVACAELGWKAATNAGRLGSDGLHGDPADRLIVATAFAMRLPLVTKDAKIRAFSAVQAIW